MKLRKEEFVTGHDGSNSPFEIIWICSSIIWSCWCYMELLLLLGNRSCGKSSSSLSSFRLCRRILLESIIIWFPMVLVQTNYLYPYGCILMIFQIILASILTFRRRRRNESGNNSDDDNNDSNNLNYVTLYRSTIYYLTFVAILAVDFELFPRKLCKTEIHGYGFMDVGAASFVISSGIIQGKSYVFVNHNKKLSSSTGVSWYTLFKPLRNAMPLIIIGILRCILNKEIDYQEHVTEYGLHWNFFFTLGVLAIIPTIRKQCILLSGSKFILSSPRRSSLVVVVPRSSQEEEEEGAAVMNSSIVYDFFRGNREGILGCIGYIFLHSCGELIGQYYIFNNVHDSNVDSGSGSGSITILLWILHFGIEYLFQFTVSRRTTNLSFCLWSLAHNITLLWSFKTLLLVLTTNLTNNTCQSIQNMNIIPIGMNLINQYGLISFLIANLMTGFINLMIPTIDISDPIAIWIVYIYICSISVVVLLYDKLMLSMSHNKSTTVKLKLKKKNE
ncbi:hypothetical protein FRACYDRAFT_200559 [Fragilariopsis cylindrus CCMP1102]|uniref:GPI-anchored wall transfer protein n=1 Tax=Fragilariopsis cylindrus CCMP1102 TaxID=635003 RepID=A0A1E7EL79_9STRA|nr:hypothetical protein FRACYDRAFT_200559 [Fragilariopsis cylindrus CCMP1102]|eukprot:OEU06671.1 hypothetical protein FRACYDRAFT_200559 [Fragilariopsis cylindrus CCMP1102]